jgi:hypothetical protein
MIDGLKNDIIKHWPDCMPRYPGAMTISDMFRCIRKRFPDENTIIEINKHGKIKEKGV